MPEVNLQSDIPVSDFEVIGARMLYEIDVRTLTLSMIMKVKEKWLLIQMVILK